MVRSLSSCLAACAVASSAVWGAGAAEAQVLDIGADGNVQVHAGPEVVIGAVDRATSLRAKTDETLRPGRESAYPSRDDLRQAAEGSGLSEHLIRAVAAQESGWNPSAISPKGARGLMQLMPPTAAALGVNPDDPRANLNGGARYLASMLDRFDGDLPKALAAYNAGPGAVHRYQGVPPFQETRRYVGDVLARLATAASGDVKP